MRGNPIVAEVCKDYEVSRRELRDPSCRSRRVVRAKRALARRMAVFVDKEGEPWYSLRDIADTLGYKSHASVRNLLGDS